MTANVVACQRLASHDIAWYHMDGCRGTPPNKCNNNLLVYTNANVDLYSWFPFADRHALGYCRSLFFRPGKLYSCICYANVTVQRFSMKALLNCRWAGKVTNLYILSLAVPVQFIVGGASASHQSQVAHPTSSTSTAARRLCWSSLLTALSSAIKRLRWQLSGLFQDSCNRRTGMMAANSQHHAASNAASRQPAAAGIQQAASKQAASRQPASSQAASNQQPAMTFYRYRCLPPQNCSC